VILLRNVLDHNLMNVVFQPVVDIETRESISFEALCRVNCPPQRPPDMWFADAATTIWASSLSCRRSAWLSAIFPTFRWMSSAPERVAGGGEVS